MSFLAGNFLVAKPVLKDPFFAQAVVLLLQHSAEGAFGLVVNRPVPVEGSPFPIFAGGPCESEGFLMLHGHADWVAEASKAVAPDIYLGDASCLGRIKENPAGEELRYRIFAGFAGWGPDQLESERAEGAWAVVPAQGQVLFETPIEELWACLVPASIPKPSLN
jgi:putative transcriptional regulator